MIKRYKLSVLIALLLVSLSACRIQSKPTGLEKPDQPVPSPTLSIPTNSPGPQPTLTATVLQPGEEVAGKNSILTSEQHGVRITITHLITTPTETDLDYIVEINPEWGFTFGKNDNPPQQTFAYSPAILVDETGHIYDTRAYHGGNERTIDPQTGKALHGGEFVFEPVSGSILTIDLYLELMTVRATGPLSFNISSSGKAQDLSWDKPLKFGELSNRILWAKWHPEGWIDLAMDGSIQQYDLRPICLYLYQTPQSPPPGYAGCSWSDEVITDLQQSIHFDPLPDLTKTIEINAAVDVIFETPFKFVWVLSQ